MKRIAPALLLILAIGLATYGDVALSPAQARPTRAARRVGKFKSLSGVWGGAYSYAYGSEQVPFNALIEENAGALTGQIDEPNTYADPAAARLYARIAGTRQGSEVRFVKTMDGTGGVSHSISYEGQVDADFTRVDGRWRLPNGWSGAFFMERSGAGAEAAVERVTSASDNA